MDVLLGHAWRVELIVISALTAGGSGQRNWRRSFAREGEIPDEIRNRLFLFRAIGWNSNSGRVFVKRDCLHCFFFLLETRRTLSTV